MRKLTLGVCVLVLFVSAPAFAGCPKFFSVPGKMAMRLWRYVYYLPTLSLSRGSSHRFGSQANHFREFLEESGIDDALVQEQEEHEELTKRGGDPFLIELIEFRHSDLMWRRQAAKYTIHVYDQTKAKEDFARWLVIHPRTDLAYAEEARRRELGLAAMNQGGAAILHLREELRELRDDLETKMRRRYDSSPVYAAIVDKLLHGYSVLHDKEYRMNLLTGTPDPAGKNVGFEGWHWRWREFDMFDQSKL